MKFNNKSGVSLIIAIIFVSMFMLVLAGLAESIFKSMRMRQNWHMSDHTRDLVRSVEGAAEFWAGAHAPGSNTSDETPAKLASFMEHLYQVARERGFPECSTDKPCAGFEVIGRPNKDDPKEKLAALNGLWFSVPRKATGSSAEKCIIEENHQNFPDDFANDSCNWNKLKIGESVDIPLFYEDAMGVHMLNGEFKLRMRAPLCEALQKKDVQGYCDFKGRIILYPQVAFLLNTGYPFRNVEKDSVLVQWLLNDENGNSSLIAWDKIYESNKLLRDIKPINGLTLQNTEISGGRINDANPNSSPQLIITDFVVLESNYSGREVLTKAQKFIKDFLFEVRNSNGKPVLHLTLVSYPRVDSDNTPSTALLASDMNNDDLRVPYVEYQLLTQDPVADNKTVLRGFAELGDFRKTFEKEIKRPTSGGGFVLENF